MVTQATPVPPNISTEKLEIYKKAYSEYLGLIVELHNYHCAFLASPSFRTGFALRSHLSKLRKMASELKSISLAAWREEKVNYKLRNGKKRGRPLLAVTKRPRRNKIPGLAKRGRPLLAVTKKPRRNKIPGLAKKGRPLLAVTKRPRRVKKTNTNDDNKQI